MSLKILVNLSHAHVFEDESHIDVRKIDNQRGQWI